MIITCDKEIVEKKHKKNPATTNQTIINISDGSSSQRDSTPPTIGPGLFYGCNIESSVILTLCLWRLLPFQPVAQSSLVVQKTFASRWPLCWSPVSTALTTSQILCSTLRRLQVTRKQQPCCQTKVPVPPVDGGTCS